MTHTPVTVAHARCLFPRYLQLFSRFLQIFLLLRDRRDKNTILSLEGSVTRRQRVKSLLECFRLHEDAPNAWGDVAVELRREGFKLGMEIREEDHGNREWRTSGRTMIG